VNTLYHSDGPCVIRYPRGGEPFKPDWYICSGNSFDSFGDADAEISVVTYGRIFAEASKMLDDFTKNGRKIKLIKNSDLAQALSSINASERSFIEAYNESAKASY
jgi:1-deoxy-D-xylulose-5-phosphate synthase